MGVLSRLLGKSRKTEEASAVEIRPDTESGGADAQEASGEPAPAEEPARTGEAAARTEPDSVAVTTAGPEIPRQQSAEEASENESGDGART